MSISNIGEVEFGAELPTFTPDTALSNTSTFADAVGWGGGRFTDHELARKEGLPGALVPGSMIHAWSPVADVEHIDTVFRAPLLADEPCTIEGLVTDIDEETGVVELDLTVKNDKDETRVFGTAKVRLPLA